MRDLVEEFRDVLDKTLGDVDYDTSKFIQLMAEKMALRKGTLDGGYSIELRDKCEDSPLTERLREAELW